MIITVDFGGSRIKLGLVDKYKVLSQRVISSYAGLPFFQCISLLKDNLLELCHHSGTELSKVEGMVWALPLIIDPGLRYASCSFGKYEDTRQQDFCQRAEEIFGIPLLLENDARAALIGEWQAGAGQGKANVAMITLGTGLGTGVIFEGRPMRGRSGMAGNLGGLSITHSSSHTSAESFGGRLAGCTETQIATWSLPERAAKIAGFNDSKLAQEKKLDYKAVFNLAAQGDKIACELRETALNGWAAMALNMIQGYDPEILIIGGGIMGSKEVILPYIRDFTRKYAVQAGGEVEIVAAQLGDNAALAGGEWIWNEGRKEKL
ncbi:MAG: ROK family protein [Sedimentisphaerales bacterium]|nr:ROK family protein [Sedimentisphaerales bacterium]MBN2843737.1 ROK family protein [Sedimentisphaerales bacterium]